MPDESDKLADAIRSLLREQMARSDSARSVATELARFVLAEAERIEREKIRAERAAAEKARVEKGVVTLAVGGQKVAVEVAGTATERAQVERAQVERAAEQVEPKPARPEPARTLDLKLIGIRASLKAASCRLYIERRDAEGDPEREKPILERMNEMIAEAKALPECFLWAFWPREVQPSDDRLRVIADCYDALAESARLCGEAVADGSVLERSELETAFQMLAEASSALRVALEWTWLRDADRDQDDAHLWLRKETQERAVFVERYMRLQEPADPGRAAELLDEVRTLAGLAERRRADQKQVDALLNRVKYHAREFGGEFGPSEHDCRRINEAFGRLAELGLRAGDPRLDSLRGVVTPGSFPGSEPASEVVRRYLAPKKEASAPAGPAPVAERAWSRRVLEARELLRDGGIVIIGGEVRQDAIDRVRDAFEPSGVEWVSLTEHGTGEPMRAPIQRADTRVVLVLIRLAGHLHAEEARAYAREAGKACVLLPAGYNPEQIAERVMEQAERQLSGV
ncbi:MAG: hypothetical protein LAT64_06835 [Phycisphaerales bacterium]|nr:hypothetical protein [Planctomycetota bacterium]MCH8508469.1 hypothetical protein [Phycisphaerales bacterium]